MKRSRTPRRRSLAPLLLALAVALGVTACDLGSGRRAQVQEQPVTQGPTPLGRQLPASIRNAREIRVGSDISYAPVEFYDSLAPNVLDRPTGEPAPQVQGTDPDLANELGRKL